MIRWNKINILILTLIIFPLLGLSCGESKIFSTEDETRMEISSPLPAENFESLCQNLASAKTYKTCSEKKENVYAHHFYPFILDEFIVEGDKNSHKSEVNEKLSLFQLDCSWLENNEEYCDYDLHGDRKNLMRIIFDSLTGEVIGIYMHALD